MNDSEQRVAIDACRKAVEQQAGHLEAMRDKLKAGIEPLAYPPPRNLMTHPATEAEIEFARKNRGR